MHIAIKYPETFPLTGYQLALFDWNLRRAFDRESFYFHQIKGIAKRIPVKRDDERVAALEAELDSLDFDEFVQLPDEVRQALPKRVGEYLGVDIQALRLPPFSARRWLARVLSWAALMAVLGLGAFAVQSMASEIRASRSPRTPAPTAQNTAGPAIEAVPLYGPSPLPPIVTNREDQADPIAEFSMVTRAPGAAAARALSSVALKPGETYRVHVSVEHVAGQEVAASGNFE